MNLVPQSTTRLKPAARPDTSSLRGILDTILPHDPFAAARVLWLTVKAAPGASCRACLHLPSTTLFVDFGEGLTDADINEAVRAELERVLRPCVEEETVEPTTTALAFNGVEVQVRGQTLSLTAMWRAAGGDPSRKPAHWLRSDAAKDFVAHIAENSKVAESQLIAVTPGKGGGTWAHWQVGMAYAKYLSPAFHAWCNRVVRAHMEGTSTPQRVSGDDLSVVQSLRAEVREMRQAMAAGFRALAGHLDGVAL